MGRVQRGLEVGAVVVPGKKSDLLPDLPSGRYGSRGAVVTFHFFFRLCRFASRKQ